jgi:hypothetical protein
MAQLHSSSLGADHERMAHVATVVLLVHRRRAIGCNPTASTRS